MSKVKIIGLHIIALFLVCLCFTLFKFLGNNILSSLIYIKPENKWMYNYKIINLFVSSILYCVPGYILFLAMEFLLNTKNSKGAPFISAISFLLAVLLLFTLMASGFTNNPHTILFLLIITITGYVSFFIKRKLLN